MTIRLEEVLEAIEGADDAFTYFYDTQTGETVVLYDALITGINDDELAEQIDSAPRGRFLRFPTKYDIHEYGIMKDFVYSLSPGAARNELISAIHGSGAFRRFKSGIRCHDLEQAWYDFRDKAFRKIAVDWCEDEGIEYTEGI